MSPRFLWVFFVAAISFPVAAFATGTNVPARRTSFQPQPAETDRPVRDGATPVGKAVLVQKGGSVDLSRLPLPLSQGPFRLAAFHVFPTQVPGPYIGPPTRIWDSGFGSSLWRNSVTGWPEN